MRVKNSCHGCLIKFKHRYAYQICRNCGTSLLTEVSAGDRQAFQIIEHALLSKNARIMRVLASSHGVVALCVYRNFRTFRYKDHVYIQIKK